MFRQRTNRDDRSSLVVDSAGSEALTDGVIAEAGSVTCHGPIPPDIESSYLSLSAYRSKPVFDIIVAGTAAALLAPLGFLIACGIRLSSRGPVFSATERIGKRGLPFRQIAFRMTNDNNIALLTPMGRVLDDTGLHKLPQLLNVLRGEMSMVGPKALRPAETHFYGSAMPVILSVKPGILEPRPIPKDERSYEDGTLVQSELDVGYVADRSFTLDLKICLDAIHQKTAGRS